MRRAFTFFIFSFYINLLILSCENPARAKIKPAAQIRNVKSLLGWKYHITMPSNYCIEEFQGADYIDFTLNSLDNTDTISCKAGIIFGNSVGQWGSLAFKRNKKDTLKSTILGKNVSWIVYDLDSSYFAETFVEGKYCASILSVTRNRNEVQNFMKIFQSLEEK